MAAWDEINNILERIISGKYTEADIEFLRQLLSVGRDRNVVQLGKNFVNIGQGKDIHIGDRILVEIIQKQHNSIPLLPKELPQEEYIRLKNLLASGRWREANDTTRTILLRVVNREKEGWLTDEQIQNFPCQVLQVIDRMWLQYSNGRFGFRVQKRICNECEKDPQAFSDRVGWRIQNALEYELSHDEAWWEGKRLEELKVRKLFSLLAACPNL